MRKRFAAAVGMLLIVAAALAVPAGTALAGSPGVAYDHRLIRHDVATDGRLHAVRER